MILFKNDKTEKENEVVEPKNPFTFGLFDMTKSYEITFTPEIGNKQQIQPNNEIKEIDEKQNEKETQVKDEIKMDLSNNSLKECLNQIKETDILKDDSKQSQPEETQNHQENHFLLNQRKNQQGEVHLIHL